MRGIALTTAVLAVLMMMGPPAYADPNKYAVNGRFTVISDGQWAKTNDRYTDQSTVTSTWTITTSCTTVLECSGQVRSDQGWTADVSYTKPMWYVTRRIENWMTCPDGTSVDGQQTYKFFVDEFDKPLLRGWDNTVGPSGACGVNKVLNVEMPLKLLPLD